VHSIKSISGLLNTNDTDAINTYIPVLQKASCELASQFDQLLNWFKNQKDGLKISLTNLEISSLIRDVIRSVSISENVKKSTLKLSNNTKISFRSDELLLKSIVKNLIANEIKHSSNPDISITYGETVNELTISLTNTRSSIDNFHKLNTFFSERETNRDSIPHDGLGLLIIKNFTSRLGMGVSYVDKGDDTHVVHIRIPKNHLTTHD